jgi:hypothetical protein
MTLKKIRMPNAALKHGFKLGMLGVGTIAVLLAISLTLSGVHTMSASADNERQHTSNNDNGDHSQKNACPSQNFLNGPDKKSSTKILDISYTAKNDEDSGIVGYWGLDHFNEHLKVWQLTDGSFYALKTYNGLFVTPQGALSPQAGITQVESGFGNIVGGYTATFTGTFTPGTNPTSGNIGTFNYAGTTADVLKGTYGVGQTGATNAYDYTTSYFTNSASSPGVDNFAQPHWGWQYKLDDSLRSATSSNVWCNYNAADGGNSGDIVLP